MLAKIEEGNNVLKEKELRDGDLASMDVEALFPSIYQKVSARLVAKKLIKNKVRYQGTDVVLATHYLDSCMSKERLREEGITHLIPLRRDGVYSASNARLYLC